MAPRKPKPLTEAEPKQELTDAEKLAVIAGIVNDPDIRRVRVRREAVLKIREVLKGDPGLVIEVADPDNAEDTEEDTGEDETGTETQNEQLSDPASTDSSEGTGEGAEGASRSW
jgi:hypothetical protein